jgi:hypothetical protein
LDEATPKLPDPEPSEASGPANGEPDTLPLTYCRVCQVEVRPVGKGRCPRCGTFLRLNFVARKGPVNVLRRDALLAELVAEYQPRTVGTRSTCEQYAATLERLETSKPGSTEWQRLITIAQTLGAALDESQTRATRTPSNLLGIDAMPSSALRLTQSLLSRLAAGDTLTEREQGQLDILQSAMRGDVALPSDTPDDPAPGGSEPSGGSRRSPESNDLGAGRPLALPDSGLVLATVPAPEKTAPAADAIDHGDAEATATMFKTMAHGSGITRW